MAVEITNLVNAQASVTGAAATTLTFNGSTYGINQAASTHSVTGTYELTLDQPIDLTEQMFSLVVSGQTATADATATVENVSDSVKTVRTFVAGTLSNAVNFYLTVMQKPNG